MSAEFFASKRGFTERGDQVLLMTSAESPDYLVIVLLADGSDVDVYGYSSVLDAEESFGEFGTVAHRWGI